MAKTMDNSDRESQPKTSIKAKLQDRELLDKLSALPETDRIKITKGLIKFLSARQSSLEQDGICDEISYTVSRLVQGLSSHRKFARLGYSVALCQILKCFDDVKVEHVLECIDQKARKQLSRQSSRGETTNVFLGKIFGYLTLVHSGRLFLEGRKNISQVVQQLLKLYTEKSSIQQLCMNALIQIIAQVKDKMFRLCILPEIKTKFTEGWGNCSPDTLLLLLYSNRYHKKKIAEFLTEHWLDPQLVSKKNFTLIAEVVKRSTCVYPLMHLVNEELVKSVVEQNLDVISFWKTVVHPLFDLKGKLVSKNTLGLHYFELLLPHLDTADKVENILHPDVADILCHTWEKQEDMRNRIANILKSLVELVKASEDAKLQLAVLKSLTMKPGHFLFDRKTKTNTISTIVSSLLPDAGSIFVKELMKMFSGQPSWLYSKDDNRSDCEQWAVKELDVLITMGDGSSEWQLDILQFLFLHTFFSVVKPSKDIVHCDHHTREMPESSRKWMTDSFFKTVSKCLSHSIQGQSRATVFGNHLDVLFQLVEYGQTLLDSKDTVKLHKDLSESAVIEWTKMLDIAKKINKKRQSDEKVGEKHAFELLFLHAGLELFSDTEGATESLQDLHVCYKKSNQRRKSKASDDGPEWIEVIIELLLSMVFKSSKNIAKLVLTALADHMTPKAFQLIVDVLQQKTTDSEEDGPLGMEEDEEMEIEAVDAPDRNIEADNDDDDDDSDNEEDHKDEEEEDDSNEEEESGTEEEANVAVDEELKKKVKTALGEAAVDSEEENNDDKEEEDLSDSEMFKFDKMLADAFICMVKGKKPKKEQESQLRDFKMRVLDLIYVIIKHHPTSSFVKDLVFPLLDLMGGGKKEEQSLRNRANDVFEHLYKVKKIIPDSSVDREELLTMISKLMQYPHKATSNDMVKQIAKAALLMIRVLLNIEDTVGPSPVKTRAQAKIAVQEKTVKVSKAWMDTHYFRVKDLASSDKLPSEVRLVLQDAIELPAIKDQDYYQEQVYKLVHSSLHKLLHKLEGHKSPLLTHTMIERYPLMFWSLSDDLVSAITDDKVKVYQKTQACGMLASLINKHVVAEIGPEIWQEFLTLLQEKSAEVLSTLTTENYKAQFMKELLTVYGKIRTISLEDCKKVLGETGVEKLGQLKTVFSTDVRGLYKKVVKQMVHNENSKQESKKKKEKVRKRKQKDDDTETKDESSPAKAAKLENEPAIELTENNESKKKKKKDRKRQQSKDDDVSPVKAAKMKKKSISTEIQKENNESKKKNKKDRKNQQSKDDIERKDEVSPVKAAKMKKKSISTEIEKENNESKKKKKKDRKNQQSKDDIERKDEVSPVKAAKMKKNSISTETEKELNNEKKKKKKKDRKLQQSKDAIERKDEVSQVKAAKMKNKPNVIETEKEEDNDAMNNLTNQEIRENLEETKNSLDLNDETNDSFMKKKRKSKKLKLKKGSVSLGMNNESISNELDLDESANADEENVKVEGNTPGKIDVSTPSKGNNDESTPSLKKKQKSKKRKMKEESGSYSMNDESISNELDLDGSANVDEENVKVEGKTLGKIKKNSNVAKATSTPAKGNNDKSTPSIENNEKNTPSKGNIDKSTPSKGINDKSTPAKGNNDKSTPAKGNNNKSTPAKGNNDKSTSAKGNNDKSTPAKGNNDKSTPSIGNNENNAPSKGNNNKSTPSEYNEKNTPSKGKNNKSTPSKGNNDESNKETKDMEENGLASPSLKFQKRKSVEGTAHTEVAKIVENSKNDTHEANPTMSAKTNEISSPSPMKKKQIIHRGSPSVESVKLDDVSPVPVNHSVPGVNGTEMDAVSVKETKPNRRRSSMAGTKTDKRDKFSPRYTRSMRKM